MCVSDIRLRIRSALSYLPQPLANVRVRFAFLRHVHNVRPDLRRLGFESEARSSPIGPTLLVVIFTDFAVAVRSLFVAKRTVLLTVGRGARSTKKMEKYSLGRFARIGSFG